MLYLSTVAAPALELLKFLMSKKEFKNLRLVGGTALALQLGHRKSIDLDLFFLLKKYSLKEMLGFYNQKYFDASTYLALKSLTYFDDADQDMDLDMLVDIEWPEVKNTILKKVKVYSGL